MSENDKPVVLPCGSGDHEFVFWDSYPNFEIFECIKCHALRFVNETTGEESYDGSRKLNP